ncbi:cobalt ABC transporter ATP-binding protein [Mycobacterium sp. GA-1841]|uniref:ABC transporter ATP-binding protein n=1 Tax=Mycobacterium sp. GA-1841 TaxID=1834154 RepID=UPI00096C2143|nr:ABC transporter ATP-binding protein [Mycobacterium sp. GA-1841]OMC39896.1 cobalt ABC transporter ATP-binding protein [Mycobacterium sp. GA-1841]
MTAKPPATTPRRGLTPGELAQAAVMAALCAATAIIAVVVPFAGGLSVLGTVPMGLLAYRYRLRVLLAATVAAGAIAFLIAGMGGMMTVVDCAYIGGLTGVVKRRGRGTATAFGAAVVAGAVFGAAAVVALTVLTRLRNLIFDSLTAGIEGIAKVFEQIPMLDAAADPLRTTFATMLDYWPLLMLLLGIFSITSVSMVGWWALSRILARLLGVPDVHKLDADAEGDAVVAPVPARLTDVRFRYPGVDRDALGPVSMELQPGEHVAVTGPNGSGKTTLMLLLAGRQPSAGSIERAGAVGLGRIGGTAVVMQHPESQVLGTRVADDVVWGLPVGTTVDVERLLGEVGLDGLAERDTGGLSGGELQRLAVAGALAREPSLLIADEVTSMVDQKGRDTLMNVLSGLTGHHQMSLVHITHYNDEAASADRTVALSGNGGTADNTDMVPTSAVPTAVAPTAHTSAPVLELTGVGHEYASGTPWAKTALRDITFTVNEGDGVLVHGLNGSGKSTLAWIMAGLTVPTYGACLLDGVPVAQQVGSVALSFQAARLQLMRSTVDREIASAAGFSVREADRIAAALEMVGLDGALAERRIDQLSGGQMRRVVLAGLLARSPRALILDEPLAGLDAASQRGLLRLLEDLRHNNGLTVVVISHDFTGLEGLCPRTLHLHRGELALAPTAAGGAR